ncbi:30S ribosomal protein S1 [Zostera marina]|uniref:rRNA biogenesis protein RRP5 n=1 Tax=Zostera marina TaxID=29655 RepID=A0A0K9NYC6_ZOSMR|nr:30S ribosomal protein S1 [Zostera marina]
MSEVAEKQVLKLDKKFKEDSFVRVRVIGLRLVEGVAIGTLKTSAFEGSIFTHSDVEPGMLANAKVIAVECFGAIVQFSCGVKALCPVSHMSEFEIAKPPKKYKNGAEFLFRVLGCKSKRLTVTHKKTMVNSKLAVIASYSDAIEGLLTHGWIAKIETHGCFVRFYNGVNGFANRDELGMEPGSEPGALYHVGQVIKCKVLASNPSSRKINITFNLSSKRTIESDCAKIGSLVAGTVQRITADSVIVGVNSSHQIGKICNEHLADHYGHITSLKVLLKPGYKFEQLLVLDDNGNNLTLSAKHSLVMSSQTLPLDVTQIRQNSILHGYICNIIGTGCFVRFLGSLTGFSPLHRATDENISTLRDAFYTGQSVRSKILNVNKDDNRITVSLKQSSCFSTDASFIQGYFLLEDKISEMQTLATGSLQTSGAKLFRIGQLVEVEVQVEKEYGVVFSIKGHDNVVGFATQYHLCGKNLETGSFLKAVVIDISEGEGLVDLSLKPELLGSVIEKGAKKSSAKKKRQRDCDVNLELHKTVNAVIESVKENYLVLSIPECNNAIGFASIFDYNTQKLPLKSFVEGQCVSVTIEAIPNSSSKRLLLLLKSLSETSELSSKRAKKKSAYVAGSFLQAEITDIKPLELFVKFGNKCQGRIHITEVNENDLSSDCPLLNFRIGQVLSARVIAKPPKFGKEHMWELSLKPLSLAGDGDGSDEVCQADADFNFSLGQVVKGYVTQVNNEWVSLMITRWVHGQLFILDSSCDPNELQDFNNRYKVGDVVSGHVIYLNPEKKLLRLVSRPLCFHKVEIDTKDASDSTLNSAKHILEGDVVGGRIKKILPGVAGMLVQIGPHLHGKVHYTELSDTWTNNPLSGYQEGQFVKCNVLEISHSLEGFMHVELSLLNSLCEANSSGSVQSEKTSMTAVTVPLQRIIKIEELHPNMAVKGYVKHISSKGCFIMLSRKIDARVLLSNLSHEYIQNTEKEFPIGKLVVGRVLSVEQLSGRVEVTLKTGTKSQTSISEVSDFGKLRAGEIISGTIRRIESYGLFITIDQTNMVGLCHISNISESLIENIESNFKTGEKVQVKILKVDQERNRISLGMKDLNCTQDILAASTNFSDTLPDGNISSDDKLVDVPTFNFDKVQDIYVDQVEPHLRSSVPPLDVKLDDMSDSDFDDNPIVKVRDPCPVIAKVENSKKRSKKKEKEERELQVSASEERLLENDVPRTSDEFEKLVRTSPDSSFVWIKYMAFLLSLADVEKARSVAERALRIINIREENEKMNIWVAYFNLENEYGNPSEDAVRRIFARALQYCEPKKLHFALLGIYQRSEKQSQVDELLEKMTKKFKNSCKVWLQYVQSHLKQNRDVQGVVKKALLCLSHHKHIKFISQAAIIEFKFGSPDRGRSMFEGMLREYPKRTDLWSVYLDQEIRLADVEVIRALFERVTCLSLPPKKMKFLLKKYLEYEKSLGDEGKIEYVTSKALEYASSI